jgi:PilZ domain
METTTIERTVDASDCSAPPLVERRSDSRYSFTVAVEAVELESGAQILARTSDVSRGGCYVDTTSPFAEGTTVKLRLTKKSESFQAEAKVIYAQVGMGMGMMFVKAHPEQRKVLEAWIGRLSGELPPELSTLILEPAEQLCVTKGSNNQQSYILSELVIELMRKGILTNGKGKAMLEQLTSLEVLTPHRSAF